MKTLISTLILTLVSVSTVLAASPREVTFDFITFQTTDGRIFEDRNEDAVWTKIDHWSGERSMTQHSTKITTMDILTTWDGRVQSPGVSYNDSEHYTGSEIRAHITDWDYFWGTTLNPENTGWNEFWNQCNDPAKTTGDCVGTVFAGIGIVVVGSAILVAGTITASVVIAGTLPWTGTILSGGAFFAEIWPGVILAI